MKIFDVSIIYFAAVFQYVRYCILKSRSMELACFGCFSDKVVNRQTPFFYPHCERARDLKIDNRAC